MITASVTNHGEQSIVTLKITGWGAVAFTMEKFPSHCGATILHNVGVQRNVKPTIYDNDAFAEVTKWLLSNRREEWNFRRSRIIMADVRGGIIDKIVHSSDAWNRSNPTINKQTSKEISFYWLDRD